MFPTLSICTSSNVFQILQDLRLKQYQGKCHSDSMQIESKTFHSTIHLHRIWHNRQLLSGPPHPPQLPPEERQQNRSIQYKYIKKLHVYMSTARSQVCKPGESLALRKVKHPLNGRTSVSRLPLAKQDILSQHSSCFEGIGCFPGNLYKFHLKPEHKPA